MPSSAIPVTLGPFTGGINTASDPTAIADEELWDCINLEIDQDGSLVSRPPILQQNGLGSWTERIVLIGSAQIAGINYLVGSNSQGTYVYDGNNWTQIKAGLQSRCAVQIRDLIYVVASPLSGQSGGYWSPGFGFTVDNSMPRGEKAVFHKSRLWIVPGMNATGNRSRLQFTDPIINDTLSWNASNIADISPGDGQILVDIIVYDDNLLLFKTNSTYVYAFDLQPSDGSIQNVNPVIGVSANRCVVLYENTAFCFHQGHVYQIVDYAFQRISEKVEFVYDGTSPSARAEEIFLSLVGDRLIFRYFNTIYVLCLRVGGWVRWVSASNTLHNFGPIVKMPANSVIAGQDKYFAGSSILNDTHVYSIQDGFDGVRTEAISCYLKTKLYDLTAVASSTGRPFIFSDSAHFKKMAWWGADILGSGSVSARANPIVASYQVKWSDVTNLLWPNQNIYIWNDPLTIPFAPKTDVADAGKVQRKFFRFLKTLRFRQIYFELTVNTDGSTATGPCRVFSLTAMLSNKQQVSKQVS